MSLKKIIENDPLAPKKPLSVYFFFADAVRDEVKNQYFEADDFDRAKIIAKRWTVTSPGDRLPYYLLHQKAMEKYNKDLLKYLDENFKFEKIGDSTKSQSDLGKINKLMEEKPLRIKNKN